MCYLFAICLFIIGCIQENHPPVILPIYPLSVEVGELLSVEIQAYDPDGDDISFEIRNCPPKAVIIKTGKTSAILKYFAEVTDTQPNGRVYPMTIIAYDMKGGKSEYETTLTVYPQRGQPYFLGPFTFYLDYNMNDFVAGIIRVRDDDDEKVDMSLVTTIDGLVFNQVDTHVGYFYFAPKVSQLAPLKTFVFQLSAKDKDHPDVIATFMIVLYNVKEEKCKGMSPLIIHEPIGDLFEDKSFKIRVSGFDDETFVRRIDLFFSENPNDQTSWKKQTLFSKRKDEFEAEVKIEKPMFNRVIFYYFKAYDNDDYFSDICDHETRLPKDGYYALVPNNSKASCIDDSLGKSNPKLPLGKVIGLRLCDGKPDIFQVFLEKSESIVIKTHTMAGSISKIALLDSKGKLMQEGKSYIKHQVDDDGEYLVYIEPSDSKPTTYSLSTLVTKESCSDVAPFAGKGQICFGNTHMIPLHLEEQDAIEFTLWFDAHKADLDVYLLDKKGNLLASSQGHLGLEKISFFTVEPIDVFIMIEPVDISSVEYEYDLHVGCPSDFLDENTNTTPLILDNEYKNLLLCPNKPDTYRVDLNGGELLDVTMSLDKCFGESPSLFVFSEDNVLLSQGQRLGGKINSLMQIPSQGSYLIRIMPNDKNICKYNLSLSITDPLPLSKDRFEPNDDISLSVGLGNGIYPHLTLNLYDIDLFGFKMKYQQALVADLIFKKGYSGSIEVLNNKGEIIQSMSSMEYANMIFVAPEKGTYYLRVFGNGVYDLRIDRR